MARGPKNYPPKGDAGTQPAHLPHSDITLIHPELALRSTSYWDRCAADLSRNQAVNRGTRNLGDAMMGGGCGSVRRRYMRRIDMAASSKGRGVNKPRWWGLKSARMTLPSWVPLPPQSGVNPFPALGGFRVPAKSRVLCS